jgi:hypothetical protein
MMGQIAILVEEKALSIWEWLPMQALIAVERRKWIFNALFIVQRPQAPVTGILLKMAIKVECPCSKTAAVHSKKIHCFKTAPCSPSGWQEAITASSGKQKKKEHTAQIPIQSKSAEK